MFCSTFPKSLCLGLVSPVRVYYQAWYIEYVRHNINMNMVDLSLFGHVLWFCIELYQIVLLWCLLSPNVLPHRHM